MEYAVALLNSLIVFLPVVICVDAFVQTNDTHMELCRALKTSRSEACRFRMRVDKLDLTCLGVARISVLLEQVEPEVSTLDCYASWVPIFELGSLLFIFHYLFTDVIRSFQKVVEMTA